MKKVLLIVFSFIALSSPSLVKAQSFSMASDTVWATIDSTGTVNDLITNNTSSPLTLKWHVLSTSFPSDWLTEIAFGICDNNICYLNTGTSTSLWNSSTNSGGTFTTDTYAVHTTTGPFHLQLDLTGAGPGTHVVTVGLSDASSFTNTTATFIITKPGVSSVPGIPGTESDVKIYPNPATNELNAVYNASADVKTIAVYNIIGKIMNVYKVTDNTSANLNIDNIPSGIYFVRLVNSHGEVVVTRKFTKQ